MTDLELRAQATPGLQAVPPAGGLEAVPGLVPLRATGGAPVCDGDSCLIPGAEGDWSEVPD